MRAPSGVLCKPSSLAIDQMMTHGWLRSRLTIALRSLRSSALVPLGVLVPSASPRCRVSSITSIPCRSHAFKERGRDGVVRGSVGVAAHLLQLLDAPVEDRVGNRDAHAREVLMVASALDLDVLPVEEETPLRIEAKGAHAEEVGLRIGFVRILENPRLDPIQTRRFEAPQLRFGKCRIARDDMS